jgi:predicted GTPase
MAKSKLDEAALYGSATKAKSSLDRIQKGIDKLLPNLKYAENQDILLVLGNTRVGKSTLVSYLSGSKLVGNVDPDDPDEVLLCLAPKSTGAEIGHGVASQTKTPTKHIATKVANMQLWDVPGFNESSTREQDIINTYLIQELMTRAQSIRIVLVAS